MKRDVYNVFGLFCNLYRSDYDINQYERLKTLIIYR